MSTNTNLGDYRMVQEETLSAPKYRSCKLYLKKCDTLIISEVLSLRPPPQTL